MDSFQFVSDPNGLYIRRFRDQSSRTEKKRLFIIARRKKRFLCRFFFYSMKKISSSCCEETVKNRRGLVKLNTKINSRDCANTRGGNFLIAA